MDIDESSSDLVGTILGGKQTWTVSWTSSLEKSQITTAAIKGLAARQIAENLGVGVAFTYLFPFEIIASHITLFLTISFFTYRKKSLYVLSNIYRYMTRYYSKRLQNVKINYLSRSHIHTCSYATSALHEMSVFFTLHCIYLYNLNTVHSLIILYLTLLNFRSILWFTCFTPGCKKIYISVAISLDCKPQNFLLENIHFVEILYLDTLEYIRIPFSCCRNLPIWLLSFIHVLCPNI